ncbi:MAG: hypothetical protein HY313_00360 [Acidobacteria bacterium]|nr:hypothetical protein [Acidobacteriota bacterium]
MSLYEKIKHWRMPTNTLSASLQAMAPDGLRGNEGIVMWLGRSASNVATITHLVTFAEHLLRKRPDFLEIPPSTMSRLTDLAETLEVSLIGQIHSHPGTFIDLSIPDRRYGISAPYYLSVVAPHYAQRPDTDWRDCGVHQFIPRAGFRRVSNVEVRWRIERLPFANATSISLGEEA